MGIEDLKRWHWIVISLFIGLAVSYMWTSFASEDIGGREISQDEFEPKLTQVFPRTKEPLLRAIVVRPIQDGRQLDLSGPREKIQVVTGEKLMETRDRKSTAYAPFTYIATVPYKPQYYPAATGDTVRDYLTQLSAKNDVLKFRYGWWREPKTATALITAASVVVIGGIWPTLINLMIGVGFARPPKPKETYDLSRFGKYKEKDKAVKAPVSSRDLRRTADMADALERQLAAGARPRDGGIESVGSADRPVQTLSGGPLDASAIPKTEEEIEVKQREFYPVIIHHEKKKPQDEKPGQK